MLAAAADFTYPEVGATRTSPLPSGYHHLRHAALIGHERQTFDTAVDALMRWQMHRRAGMRVVTEAAEAAPGVTVATRIGLGPLSIAGRCRVVWAERTPHRSGFAYGTLAGHPVRGEEAFVLELNRAGQVWFTVSAFSVPAAWYARAGGPLTPRWQRWFARRYATALTRLAA